MQQNELTAAVARLVSADQLASLEQADRVIFGQVRRDESWRASLTVVDPAGKPLGEREIKSDAPSCSELSASVALAIALIIDPDHIPAASTAVEAEVPPAASPPNPPGTPSNVPSPSVASSAPPPEPAPRVIVFSPRPQRSVKGSAVLLWGLLPELAIGAQLEFWQPLVRANSLRFALAYFGAQTVAVPDRPEASVTFYLVTARAAYCPLLAAAPKLSVFGCAGLESGLMVGHGQGGGFNNSPARPLLALDGALTVDWAPSSPWAASLTSGAALTPFRPQFSYQTTPEPIDVHRPSYLDGRLEIGLSYRF